MLDKIKNRLGLGFKSDLNPHTFDDLYRDLVQLPFERDSVVFIHSSLRAFGHLDDGAQTVVAALEQALVKEKNITILMPSFTIDSTMHGQLVSAAVFDVKSTPTRMGKIPELFLQHPNVYRSIHPTHSVSGLGPKAEQLLAKHHLCDTNFGVGTPFYELVNECGYVMGLGSNLGKVTFYHAVEDASDKFPFDVYTKDSPISVKVKGHQGETLDMSVSAHCSEVSKIRIDKPNGVFIRELFLSALKREGVHKDVDIGRAQSWYCRADEMFKAVEHLATKNITVYTGPDDILDCVLSK